MSDLSVFDKLSDKVSKFNQQIDKHKESQQLNPFSGSYDNSRSPSPRYGKFTKEEYGKPVAGSDSERRGLKAKAHLLREMLDLCIIIHDLGEYHAKHRKDDDPDDRDRDMDDDGTIMVTFGELFNLYTKISDKVVGLLMAAKKKGWVYFEPEILFQRRDDDVLIALLKPVSEIKKYVDEETKPVKQEVMLES